MAAIDRSTIVSGKYPVRRSQSSTASATTDYIATPAWAKSVVITFSPTAITTSVLPTVDAVDPVGVAGALDDSLVAPIGGTALSTGITGANTTHIIQIGPDITGIANAVTFTAGADSVININTILPRFWRIVVTPTGATAWNLHVEFKASAQA